MFDTIILVKRVDPILSILSVKRNIDKLGLLARMSANVRKYLPVASSVQPDILKLGLERVKSKFLQTSLNSRSPEALWRLVASGSL